MDASPDEHAWVDDVRRDCRIVAAPPFVVLNLPSDAVVSADLVMKHVRLTQLAWRKARAADPSLARLDAQFEKYVGDAARTLHVEPPPAPPAGCPGIILDKPPPSVSVPVTFPAPPAVGERSTASVNVVGPDLRTQARQVLERMIRNGLNAVHYVPDTVVEAALAELRERGFSHDEVDEALRFWTRGKTSQDVRARVAERVASMVETARSEALRVRDSLPERAIYRRQLDDATEELQAFYGLDLSQLIELFEQVLREQRVQTTPLKWPGDRKGVLDRVRDWFGR